MTTKPLLCVRATRHLARLRPYREPFLSAPKISIDLRRIKIDWPLSSDDAAGRTKMEWAGDGCSKCITNFCSGVLSGLLVVMIFDDSGVVGEGYC